jgi:preprotein translocase subunit SecD
MFYLKRFIFIGVLLCFFVSYAAQNTQQQLVFQVMKDKLVLDRTDIEKIQLQAQDDGQPTAIDIQLTADATQKLQDFSEKNIGEHMQTIWNGIILNDAVIQTPLPGKFLITLNVSRDVAQEMVSRLQ